MSNSETIRLEERMKALEAQLKNCREEYRRAKDQEFKEALAAFLTEFKIRSTEDLTRAAEVLRGTGKSFEPARPAREQLVREMAQAQKRETVKTATPVEETIIADEPVFEEPAPSVSEEEESAAEPETKEEEDVEPVSSETFFSEDEETPSKEEDTVNSDADDELERELFKTDSNEEPEKEEAAPADEDEDEPIDWNAFDDLGDDDISTFDKKKD